MRSQPMKNGRVVDSFNEGTVYAISISIPSERGNMTAEPAPSNSTRKDISISACK